MENVTKVASHVTEFLRLHAEEETLELILWRCYNRRSHVPNLYEVFARGVPFRDCECQEKTCDNNYKGRVDDIVCINPSSLPYNRRNIQIVVQIPVYRRMVPQIIAEACSFNL